MKISENKEKIEILSTFLLEVRTGRGDLYSNEAALPLRSRRSGTKFAAPSRTAH